MALTFETVAKDIIKETISSALFIDDKALEPFRSKSKKAHLRGDHTRSKALYEDFKANDCLLHVTKFSKAAWKRDKDFNLKNKDLLILDWQLVREDHQESLKILDESVIIKGLHFCCIYTQASLQEVKNELNRFYLGQIDDLKRNEIRLLLTDTRLNDFWLIDNKEQDWLELDVFINNIVNAKKVDAAAEIEAFRDAFDLTPEIMASISAIDPPDIRSAYMKLKSALNIDPGTFTKCKNNHFLYRLSEIDGDTVYINHTIIKLIEKNQVNGSQLYQNFLDSIMMEENIFLTLLGLEMRNRFRENSAFVGKDLDNVSEEAFFYHRVKNAETLHIFEEFLREILKDQVASFLYERDLKIFGILDDYFVKKGIQAKIDELLLPANVAKFKTQSFKLNKFYNIYNLSARKTNDFLRFGDILKGTVTKLDKDKNPFKAVKYFLCITALCDCLRPEKINNQFWFVEGDELTNQNKGMEKTDGKFFSFVVKDNDVIAIDWENNKEFCIPFAMHIYNNIVSKGIKAQYFQETVELELVASLKENYAQRIANEAFGYPIRVGIDFVKKK